MESFSSIVSLTYARRRQASSPLQTSCFPKHELNGVFFECHVPDIRSQATSLISIADKLLPEARTQWILSKHHVPDIRTSSTSLTSIIGKLLHEYKLNGISFKCYVSEHTLTRYKEN
ncbi:unnamed protein product [Prunus brigantina]